MIDLTSILTGVVTLLSAVVTAFLIPLIKEKTNDHQLKNLMSLVELTVAAAEQVLPMKDGAKRREFVLDFLESKGYDIDNAAVDVAIESAVLKLHKELSNEPK